jgi:hypothetical protein
MKYLISLLWLLASVNVLAQTEKAEEQILALSKRKFDWLISRNYDSIRVNFDSRLQYVHSNGWTQTRQEVLDDMKSGKLDYQKITIHQASARVYAASAIVVGTGKFEGLNQGTAFALDLRYTEVYVRDGHRWKLASRHANRMP